MTKGKESDAVMMLYPTMPQLLKNVNNRYMLVNVIARRAREIAELAEEEGNSLEESPVSMAVQEIAEDKLKATQTITE